MKRLTAATIVFLALLFGYPCAGVFAQEAADDTQASQGTETSKASFFDNISDWYATLGKTAEEKEKVLQERRDKRAEDQTTKACEEAKAKAQSAAQDVKARAAEGVATAKEKAATLKEQAKVKAEEKAAALKGQAQQKIDEAKGKAAQEAEACKTKLKGELNSSLDKAKDLLGNW